MQCGRYIRLILGFMLVFVIPFALAGQESGAPDIAMTDIQFEIIPQAPQGERPALVGEDQAIIGDIVRLRAVVENRGDAPAGRFRVDFFYEEKETKETDIIGTATIFGLDMGDSKKPAVSWNTSTLIPGVYEIYAEAGLNDKLGETDRCNNVIPRGECDGERSVQAKSVTILRLGLHISEGTGKTAIPTCPMGRYEDVAPSIALGFTNVGTEMIEKGGLKLNNCYRLTPTQDFTCLQGFTKPLLGSLPYKDRRPGEKINDFLTVLYDKFDDIFANSKAGLGVSNEIQLKLEFTPNTGEAKEGETRRLFIPSPDQFLKFYSRVDLWTFPKREGCGDPQHREGEEVRVPPAVASDGRVYPVISTAGKSDLYALTELGGEDGHYALDAEIKEQPVAVRIDANNTMIYLISSSPDSHVYAIQDFLNPDSGKRELREEWRYPSDGEKIGDNLTRPYVVLSEPGKIEMILVGSENGLYALDSEGKLEWSLSKVGGEPIWVSKSPIITTEGGTAIWFATRGTGGRKNRVIRCQNISGEEQLDCRTVLESSEQVTTPLVTNQAKNTIFFGTDEGNLYAYPGEYSVTLKTTGTKNVTGLKVTRRGKNDVLYASTKDGTLYEIEFNGDNLEKISEHKPIGEMVGTTLDVLTEKVEDSQGNLIVEAGEALAVLITTAEGKLYAIDPDLEEVMTVNIWNQKPAFVFSTPKNTMTAPIVDPWNRRALVGSTDGFLYAFDLSQFDK